MLQVPKSLFSCRCWGETVLLNSSSKKLSAWLFGTLWWRFFPQPSHVLLSLLFFSSTRILSLIWMRIRKILQLKLISRQLWDCWRARISIYSRQRIWIQCCSWGSIFGMFYKNFDLKKNNKFCILNSKIYIWRTNNWFMDASIIIPAYYGDCTTWFWNSC